MLDPQLTGIPFNDAYRYMDWLLTVPLLLIEILLVMKLDEETYNAKAWTLGFGSALMIASGYYGELVVTGDLTPLGLLVLVHDVLLVHRLRTPRWLVRCHQHGGRPSHCRQDQDRTGDDRDQLVHIPNCVLVPHARCQRRTSSCLHPDGLLRVRHHLQVRCRLGDLPDLLRQIPEGGPLGMKKLTWPFSFFCLFFLWHNGHDGSATFQI